MNLIFTVKDCPGAYVDFPFQTPTNLTYSVFNAESVDEKLKLIKERLIEWDTDKERIDEILTKIKTHLLNDKLELSVI